MNHLRSLQLKNNYIGMRHGESLANCQALIVSKPENGINAYGLSDRGKQQVKLSVSTSVNSGLLTASVQIISSDFKRAHESALIAHGLLDSVHDIVLDARLRERDFGDYELGSNNNYERAWKNDALDPAHTIDNVESANSVMNRVSSLILSLEEQFSEQSFLLVAHGDTLQILQSAFQQKPASRQRELPHLNTAEIRRLVLVSENL